jgi:cytochrome c oxidase cbb3-type subunit IV
MNDVGGALYPILLVAAFVAVVWWAFGRSRKRRFEQDARIPFDEPD